jgi:hypothetical protein
LSSAMSIYLSRQPKLEAFSTCRYGQSHSIHCTFVHE